MQPGVMDLTAARNVPFDEEFPFTDDGEPVIFTGWTGTMQVRLYQGAAGSALISLSNVTTDVEGVRNLGDGWWRVKIAEATLVALPVGTDAFGHPVEAGGFATLAYDLVLADTTGFQERWLAGAFVLTPGVTT